tara:strand:- start:353 stop:1111 length:759 start_codon:yes stop_codon:yes gene_type:complete
MKKFKNLLLFCSISVLSTACGTLNIKTGNTDFQSTDGNVFDNQNRDIISQEYDAAGILQDCTIGKSSRQRRLPSCNSVRNKREKILKQQVKNQTESFKKLEQEKQKRIINKKKKISKILDKQISGRNFIKFDDGSGILVKSTIKFNGSNSNLIINAEVERDRSTTIESFKKLFIEDGKYIQISFIDADGFELISPVILPLNIVKGQNENIVYRKKSGNTAENIIAVRMLARKPLDNILEFSKVKRLQISLRK